MAGCLRRPKAAIPTGEGRNPGRAAPSGPDPTSEGGARHLFPQGRNRGSADSADSSGSAVRQAAVPPALRISCLSTFTVVT